MTTEIQEATEAKITCAQCGDDWPCAASVLGAPGHRASKPSKPAKKAAPKPAPAASPHKAPVQTRATGHLSRLASLLERIYAVMQGHHPDLPDVMFIVGVGTRTDREGMTFGHFGAGRWQFPKSRIPELMISGEGLGRGSRELLNTLLHEAGGHGLAMVRKIDDTSRGGRYHNRKFAALAREVGLTPPEEPTALGFSSCTLPEETWDKYADVHELLDEACRVYRHAEASRKAAGNGAQGDAGEGDEGEGTDDSKTSGKRVKATCGCGRAHWASRSVLVQAPNLCLACLTPYIAPGINEDHVELVATVLATLGEAAQAALGTGDEE
jgi:hypothetical protein